MNEFRFDSKICKFWSCFALIKCSIAAGWHKYKSRPGDSTQREKNFLSKIKIYNNKIPKTTLPNYFTTV